MVDLKYEMDGLIPLPGAPNAARLIVLTVPEKCCLIVITSFFLGRLFVEEGASSDSLSLASDFRALFCVLFGIRTTVPRLTRWRQGRVKEAPVNDNYKPWIDRYCFGANTGNRSLGRRIELAIPKRTL